MNSAKFPVLSLPLVFLLLACGAGGEAGRPDIVVEDAWVRATMLLAEEGRGGTNSAAYFVLRNAGGVADRLQGGETEAAASVEIHESRVEDDVMRMRRVDDLQVPPGGEVVLRPGGFHIMLLGLQRPLTAGDTILLSLDFQHTGRVDIRVPVRVSGQG
jgi:copper(I)-binding protein